jgi:hypothetical protein
MESQSYQKGNRTMKHFDTFGVMIDMSRNAVMKVDSLKNYMSLLKKMGYNTLMLYTEDTYEVNGEPYFGYMRGRYSKEELKEIDGFGQSIGMEVIPCIETLAHLDTAFQWGKIPNDTGNILLCDDERTYELIDRMFQTISECFKTKKVNVGMDEAHMLGRGKYLDKHGYVPSSEILKRHLSRVIEISQKYGLELMVWSDMFFGNYSINNFSSPDEETSALLNSVTPVYWDYHITDEQVYSDKIKKHLQISKNTWYAGGAWGWFGMIPHNQFTLRTMIPALDACKKNKVKNVFITMWGDHGAECSHITQLPALFYLAEHAKGVTDASKIKKKFKSLIGIDFDDFMKIDSPNDIENYIGLPRNPSTYMLYSDYFNGFLDYTVKEGLGEKYSEIAAELLEVSKKSRKYGYVFDSAAKLSNLLSVKYELGVKTRAAYQKNDKEALRGLALNEYTKLEKLIREYITSFRKQWMRENKPHGFEVQEQRLGGLLLRTESCKKRIIEYTSGKLDKIDELEETLLPFGEKDHTMLYLGPYSPNIK